MPEMRQNLEQRQKWTVEKIFKNLKKETPHEGLLRDIPPSNFNDLETEFAHHAFKHLVRDKIKVPKEIDTKEGPTRWFQLQTQRQIEIRKTVKETLKNSVLVDLGCGEFLMESLASQFGAKGYIGVDKYFARGQLPIDPTKNQIEELIAARPNFKASVAEARLHGTDVGFTRADMLDFVSRLPENSVNFTLNGIDIQILGNELSRSENIMDNYRQTLAKEILRATRQNGIIFGSNFGAVSMWFDKWAHSQSPQIKSIYHSGPYTLDVYRKIH